MADTLLLDSVAWDLVLDVEGDIALAAEPYSLAQDAACAIKTFLGECWYDTTVGIDYLGEIFGRAPSLALLKARMVAAARTVPDVATAQCFITGASGRSIIGQVQVTSAATGQTSAATFSVINPQGVG